MVPLQLRELTVASILLGDTLKAKKLSENVLTPSATTFSSDTSTSPMPKYHPRQHNDNTDPRDDFADLERRVYEVERCQIWHGEDIANLMGHIAAIASRLPPKREEWRGYAQLAMPLD